MFSMNEWMIEGGSDRSGAQLGQIAKTRQKLYQKNWEIDES